MLSAMFLWARQQLHEGLQLSPTAAAAVAELRKSKGRSAAAVLPFNLTAEFAEALATAEAGAERSVVAQVRSR